MSVSRMRLCWVLLGLECSLGCTIWVIAAFLSVISQLLTSQQGSALIVLSNAREIKQNHQIFVSCSSMIVMYVQRMLIALQRGIFFHFVSENR